MKCTFECFNSSPALERIIHKFTYFGQIWTYTNFEMINKDWLAMNQKLLLRTFLDYCFWSKRKEFSWKPWLIARDIKQELLYFCSFHGDLRGQDFKNFIITTLHTSFTSSSYTIKNSNHKSLEFFEPIFFFQHSVLSNLTKKSNYQLNI